MTAPISVNAQTDVEINDSCNCCFPWRRRHKHIEKKVDKVYQENRSVEKPKVEIKKTAKKIHSDPVLLQTTGEWIFESNPKLGFQGYE
jgi:hypothetical protein